MINQAYRVCELLRRFNNNEIVCIEKLKDDLAWEGKGERTIRRDLEIVKAIFPGIFKPLRIETGCYKALTKQVFENFLDEKKISLMVQIFSIAQYSDIFENLDINSTDKMLIEDEIKELRKVYEFKTRPFENKYNNYELIKKLEKSIKYRKEILLEYQLNEVVLHIKAKPYKILFMNENFYLASEVEHKNYSFSIHRLSRILNIEFTGSSFYLNGDIAKFIKFMQTPLAKYIPDFKNHLTEVILEVEAIKAKHFKAKRHLLSQQIVEEKENGNLIIKFDVTSDEEMEDLIKRWIPYVKVISPQSLKNRIIQELKSYINH